MTVHSIMSIGISWSVRTDAARSNSLRTGAGGIDEVPERIALRPLDLPAALEALPVDLQQRRIRLVPQQRVIRQERQLVVRVVDRARHHDLLVAREQMVLVRA